MLITILILCIILTLAIGAQFYGVYLFYKSYEKSVSNVLDKVHSAHLQVINAEKISRQALESSEKSFNNMDETIKRIENIDKVCTWLSLELERARKD